MPFGSPPEVKIAVKECLDAMGPKGGMMVAPTHVLEPEVPWENIIAYVDACREYKK
jgi:uroporphyrinogen decarboxylase